MSRPPPLMLPEDGFNELATCRHGLMLFNRNDRYVGASLRKYGEFSPAETTVFRTLIGPGMTVIEVGANIGAHTVELSRVVGPHGSVVAFEPQRLVFQTLCANLALNSCANVVAWPYAVGAAAGEILVPVLAPDRPNNFGGLSLHGCTAGEPVRLVTLDEMRLPACHFLKLDLEGMELEALRGAAATIAAYRPFIYAENDRPAQAPALTALLRSWDYRLLRHDPPLYDPDNFAGDPENIFPRIVSNNLLCLPVERGIATVGFADVTPP